MCGAENRLWESDIYKSIYNATTLEEYIENMLESLNE